MIVAHKAILLTLASVLEYFFIRSFEIAKVRRLGLNFFIIHSGTPVATA